MATNQLDFQNFFSTVLSSTITATDTTIYLNTLPTPSEGYLVIEPDSDTNKEIIYYTSKGANYVTCPDVATGRGVGGTTAASHSSGATVQRNVVAEDLREVQNGNSNTGLHTYFDESFNDYVLNGGSITQATGLIASVSSGVAYINGRRLPFNAISKTLTASKDTYFDLVETDGSNLATISYTELASGATGSTPVSNGMHIGMVRSNASLLATIYQSALPNGFSDKLGYPLYNIRPSQILLGHAVATANTTNATDTTVQVTGLSVTVQIPPYATVKVTASSPRVANTTSGFGAELSVWDGVVASGTRIGAQNFDGAPSNNFGVPMTVVAYQTNNTSNTVTKVYNAGLLRTSGGTATLLFTGSMSTYGILTVERVA